MRPLVESDWEPRTSHPSDGSSSKYSTRKNRFQVPVQETEDERTCNHNNQVCSIMEQRFELLRGIRLKKKNTGVYVRNNLFTSMEEMIDSFFVKPVQTIQGKQHETVQ